MVSLIMTINKQQKHIFLEKFIQEICNCTLFTTDNNRIICTTVIRNKLIIFMLRKKRFTVLLTGRIGKHIAVFSYKVTQYSIKSFFRGLKRFLTSVLDITENKKNIRKTFEYLMSHHAVPVDELLDNYLTVPERVAIARWKQKREGELISWSTL